MKESNRNDQDIKEGNLTFAQHRELLTKTILANELKARNVVATLERIRADVAAGKSQYTDHLNSLTEAFDTLDQLQAIVDGKSKTGLFDKLRKLF